MVRLRIPCMRILIQRMVPGLITWSINAHSISENASGVEEARIGMVPTMDSGMDLGVDKVGEVFIGKPLHCIVFVEAFYPPPPP
jgi:hypothetical protein